MRKQIKKYFSVLFNNFKILTLMNWQRDVEVTDLNGKKVIVKKDKSTKVFNEYFLIFLYSIVSVFLLHPTPPPKFGRSVMINESEPNRKKLDKLGIPTPRLYYISKDKIIEEFIEDGNLYKFLKSDGNIDIVFKAGVITGKLHKAGFCFIDNKAQNYLVNRSELFRTDIGFIQKQSSIFAKSLDIGLFLSSLIDLDSTKYKLVEKCFLDGFKSETGSEFPYLSIIIRNISSLCISLNHHNLIMNLFPNRI
jgi:tRNA A-37 threonylcarbamoyl transferase component Bud32